MSILLRDVIDLPERAGAEDYVLRLTDSVGHEAARSKPELQPVVAKHDPTLADRKILPLAFHPLDAKSLEQALFDGYLRQIKAVRPEAALPAVHRSEALLQDAERLRERLGDSQFFAGLNGGRDAWSAVLEGDAWDEERYRQALVADRTADLRLQLISALVETYFRSYT